MNPGTALPLTKTARKAELAQLKSLRTFIASCFPQGMPAGDRVQFDATQARIVALIAADRK